jgi:signal transduction histidine kinase
VSYLGLPMIAKGEAVGVLSFYVNDEQGFTPEDTAFLTSLANQAAMAIDNSRLYQQTRNQAIELERSNKIKDEFLGVMSHELRTPLNIIMNYAEGLRTGMFGEMNRDQERGTDKIEAQARHLLYLINGILEITKIETGTVIVQEQAVDLANFVNELRSDYMMPLERDVTLQWEHPSDLPTIATDPIKLKQILNNLINNAIKFTDHGSITVSVHIVDQGNTLELKVADTGPGIPNHLLPVVFEKFRQIDSTTTRSHSGAGLGLYIVKTFAELLHGTVSVQSKVGEGSIFTVRLPAGLAQQTTPHDYPAVHAPQGSSS